MEALQKRNQKGLYSGNTNEAVKDVMGLDIAYEEPKSPNFILENDGDIIPEEQAKKILRHFGFLKR